jgi:two-component system chemotaxis response regulator CheB
MFRSAARAYGERVVGVVLSGQLDDGAAGLAAIKMAGGMAIVQDPEEATAPEMPTMAIQYNQVDCVLPVAKIAELISSLSSEKLPLPDAQEAHGMSDEMEVNDENREGDPSVFACPDCHGVLWEVQEGKLLRYRCRVGHAYTAEALNIAMSEASEDSLWVAMRTLEEKTALLRRLAQRSGQIMKRQYTEQADAYKHHADEIRRMLQSQAQMKKGA